MFELILLIVALMFFPLLLWMMIAGVSVRTTFNKYSTISAKCGLTASQVARKILDDNGLLNVRIEACGGVLTDHYDPRNETVYLSQATINSNSLSAIGVAAHEVGHAIQHAEEYAPIKFRTAIVPVVNYTAKFITPLILLGIVFEIFAYNSSVNIASIFYLLALVCYGFYALFTFITLPCEYNASSRAKKQLLECGILDEDEVAITSKVLSSAAKTYLVSFLLSLAQIARLLLMLLGTRRRND